MDNAERRLIISFLYNYRNYKKEVEEYRGRKTKRIGELNRRIKAIANALEKLDKLENEYITRRYFEKCNFILACNKSFISESKAYKIQKKVIELIASEMGYT